MCAKKLSICIPTFNRAGVLKEALESILLEVNGNESVEILVSDNASTDETPTLVQRYTARYPIIRYARNPKNEGFDGNIVACIERSEGEYLSFFSDDDLALPGTFDAILNYLAHYQPAIVYLNHYPFYDNNYLVRVGLKHPERNQVFTDGKAFLMFAGLGFISALTVKSAYAREFISQVKHGLGQAHLDIAARIALRKPGPFVFLGTRAIAARVPAQPSYDSVTFAAINEANFYHDLEAAGLLDAESVKRRVGGSIRHNLLRAVLAKKCLGDHKHLASQRALLQETYGRYLPFYSYVYPVLLLPRALLVPPYLLARALVRWIEQRKSYA
jgi:glycosyltransferase involved in cell wall biosynthesis